MKREDSDVVGNVLRKRRTAYATGGFNVTRFGGDGTGESSGRYRVVNNTIIVDTGAAFRLFDSLESVEMDNNVFVSATGAAAPIVRTVEAEWTSGEQISGRNNWVQNVLTTIPTEWAGTIRGSDPGCRNFSGGRDSHSRTRSSRLPLSLRCTRFLSLAVQSLDKSAGPLTSARSNSGRQQAWLRRECRKGSDWSRTIRTRLIRRRLLSTT